MAMWRRYGATAREIEFLRTRRVELNAFLARTLIDYLVVKFKEHGVEKVVPDAGTLASVFRHATERELVRAKMAKVEAAARREAERVAAPPDLLDRVRQRLAERPTLAWDAAVTQLAGKAVGEGRKAR